MSRPFFVDAPKAELHLHIEGTISPEFLLLLAERNGVALPYASINEIEQSYRFNHFDDFLIAYRSGVALLRTERDFYDLAHRYMQRAAADGVVHLEAAVGPHSHLSRGIAPSVFMDGLLAGFDKAARDFGMTYAVIVGLQRERGPEAGFEALTLLSPYRDRIAALGLQGQEASYPPAPFAGVYRKARDWGWKAVVHAGEGGPPEYVAQALDALSADRIDHGIRAWEDPDLIKRLVDEQVPLTVCPLSNIACRNFERMEDHPLADMFRAGVCVTLNSDDPPLFGGYLNDNFQAAVDTFALTTPEQHAILQNGFTAAFLPHDKRQAYGQMLDAHVLVHAG